MPSPVVWVQITETHFLSCFQALIAHCRCLLIIINWLLHYICFLEINTIAAGLAFHFSQRSKEQNHKFIINNRFTQALTAFNFSTKLPLADQQFVNKPLLHNSCVLEISFWISSHIGITIQFHVISPDFSVLFSCFLVSWIFSIIFNIAWKNSIAEP